MVAGHLRSADTTPWTVPMTLDEVVRTLTSHQREITTAHGVASLAIFGSVARGDALPTSDVDVLVECARPTGLLALVGLKQRLEATLGCAVDLATRDELHPVLRADILSKAVRAL